MTTTWQQINDTEVDNDGQFDGYTLGELKQLRRELFTDARDFHSYGSHGEAEAIEQDITEIELILGYALTFPRWKSIIS